MSDEKSGEAKSNLGSNILIALIVALIGVNIYWVLNRDSAGTFAVGEEAPNFTLPVANPGSGVGDEVELADLQGKVVVLDFWATWCQNCVRAFPRIEKLHREANKDELVVLAISNEQTGEDEARELVTEFLDAKGYTVPVLLDNASVFNTYRVNAIPRIILINRDGEVARVYETKVSDAELDAEIASLLE